MTAHELLAWAERLYSSYGLIAASPDCGAWINEVRALLDQRAADEATAVQP